MYSTKGLNLLHQQGNNRARRVADLLCNMRTRFAILSFIHSFKFIRLAQSEDSITYHRVNNEKERKKKKTPNCLFSCFASGWLMMNCNCINHQQSSSSRFPLPFYFHLDGRHEWTKSSFIHAIILACSFGPLSLHLNRHPSLVADLRLLCKVKKFAAATAAAAQG